MIAKMISEACLNQPIWPDALKEQRERNEIFRVFQLLDDKAGSLKEVFLKNPVPATWVEPTLSLIGHIETPNLLDGCVRMLIGKASRGIAEKPLIALFDRLVGKTDYAHVCWTVGNAIEFLGPDRVAADIARIASDKRIGFERQIFVASLAKLKSGLSPELLGELLTQPCVALHAVTVARKLRNPRLIPALERLAEVGRNAHVRQRARSAAERLREIAVAEKGCSLIKKGKSDR